MSKAKVKDLKRSNKYLSRQNALLRSRAMAAEGSAVAWRRRYEEVTSSPEIKADTEAAFQRGAARMKQSMASWLFHEMQKITAEESK